ncbi:ABC transporter permease [Streptomyces sp. YIM 98790]|uniref:ABC transporter permease n=1 Tax=Streptomyces sp. YIM 98790 TaxID=2689077 RepID=UPI00140B59F8|nr:ABC transporter permease [Streptomyces sp. YIM 98790]
MGRYVARRLLQMIPVFIGTTFLVFCMIYVLPGDPVRSLWGDKVPDPAQLAAIRQQLGLDQPLWKQYLDYMGGLLTGDLGTTTVGRPVADEMGRAFPVTIRLAAIAFLFSSVAGIALGVLGGMRRGRYADTGILVFTMLVISMPVFVLGYVMRHVFATELGWVTPTVQNSEEIGQLLLPGVVLGMLSLAYVARLTRTTVAENLRADFMRTARAKGLPKRRIVRMHLLRNSMIPVVTFLGTDIGALMGGAIVTEGIFNVQGVGRLVYDALVRRESAVVVGTVTVLVLIYLAANLLVDLLYAVLDPRIRYA